MRARMKTALLVPALTLALAVPARAVEADLAAPAQQATDTGKPEDGARGSALLEILTLPCRVTGDAGAIACVGLLGVFIVAGVASKIVALATGEESEVESPPPDARSTFDP
jgi:hypothetical protein